jgi:hypothetical protein
VSRALFVRSDVKTSLMELHDLGPCKLFDTAGLDEPGELGAKKRAKVGVVAVLLFWGGVCVCSCGGGGGGGGGVTCACVFAMSTVQRKGPHLLVMLVICCLSPRNSHRSQLLLLLLL